MVSLTTIHSSNARIPTSLPGPPHPIIALFVGATNGIGEATLKAFAKHTNHLHPRVYFIGRSASAGDRIVEECEKVNPSGTFTFIASDTSLLGNVDDICREIREKEKYLNILFLSTGTFASSATGEGLHLPISLVFYSRVRFMVNLLPLIRAAPRGTLRRVVSTFTGTKEGPINFEDIQGWKIPVSQFVKMRGHAASLVTLSMVGLAERRGGPNVPNEEEGVEEEGGVGFVHDFPGPVRTGIAREMKGWVMGLVWPVLGVLGAVMGSWVPILESGERHLYLATSAAFNPLSSSGEKGIGGVEVLLGEGEKKKTTTTEGGKAGTSGLARGIDGVLGSGVYSVDEKCESAPPAVERFVSGMKKDGLVERVWGEAEAKFKEILGTADAV